MQLCFLQGQGCTVMLELGHESRVKSHIYDDPSYKLERENEPTHDWEFWIKDREGGDMSKYVEKLVINLHETFKNPKREYKHPPYVLKEQGYASFEIFLDIYFRGVSSSDKAKKVSRSEL